MDRGIVVDTGSSPHSLLHPVPISSARIDDEFWRPRRRALREAGLPRQFEMCEATGRIDNFRRLSNGSNDPFQGRVYNDSDVYKLLEAASHALAEQHNQDLAATTNGVIDAIAGAQRSDGYVHSYFALEREHERYSDLTTQHELYCAGHLIQAGIAHRRATGSGSRLFDVARRFADHICGTFGPDAREGVDGHEEIELALAELYRETGDRKYLDQSIYFLEARGRQPSLMPAVPGAYERAYYQDHLPVTEQTEVVGHAVRATYLATGMMDAALESHRPDMARAATKLWESAFERKSYVTGGLGSRYEGESFGDDYELPNESAYAETCAAIGGVFWSWRMLCRTGDAKYADAIETALYNGALSGVSLDGTKYFYVNPLSSRGGYERADWFDCACCPPNIARLLMSLPGYLYSTSEDSLWVHFYAAGGVRASLPYGGTIEIEVETNYPWDGDIRLNIVDAPASPVALRLRIPGWCEGATVTVNGRGAQPDAVPGTYLDVKRRWTPGDVLSLCLPMPVRKLSSHQRVTTNQGRLALARGPLIYCIEAADHPDVDLFEVALDRGDDLDVKHNRDLLGGVTVLSATGDRLVGPAGQGNPIRTAHSDQNDQLDKVPITAIPYYAWGNRGIGAMQVWMPAISEAG
ncbi:MAG: glycoside hydrolase family 127 protein [Chloroflexi bacterium]|nr:glycoside hydrolase family 127 protein [Chloroflexota bacterium]MCY3936797.1 glycoside hydrolase family 127 protein [Chloroflexota bacterium]